MSKSAETNNKPQGTVVSLRRVKTQQFEDQLIAEIIRENEQAALRWQVLMSMLPDEHKRVICDRVERAIAQASTLNLNISAS